MSRSTPTKPQSTEQDADFLSRLGGWLFKHRTSIPVPIAVALLLIPASSSPLVLSTSLAWLGVPIVAAAELIRLSAVHHIGVISRTRSDRLGPLIDTGPFSLVRNPLYLGNILLWLGFAISARLLWLAPVIVLLLAFEYHAIVRWEERLLASRLGASYREYAERVPRWRPLIREAEKAPAGASFSWGDTFYSERGTLIAIGVGYGLLALKARW
jgi:protein-S-isoprenylcysteine O-methyltransferase Ste14